ncbi:unnamed protein product [Mytilus coruscus]|uniref:Uncharacterized protein n=1 Tax=Mytilus coruscus TaxID=42192 RepID=A0A6J8BCT3_MYTCO|nr:unnamed protein product [Mytilus coruscus]
MNEIARKQESSNGTNNQHNIDLRNNFVSAKDMDDEEYASLSISDFAGDREFYNTHQTFLSEEAIYLVVTTLNETDDETNVYSHLVFTLTSLTLEDSEDPIPNWPIKHPENLYDLNGKENKTSEVEQKLHSVNKLLKSTKKKVQRINQNILGLKPKLHEAYKQFETDTESMKLYYNGIVENLKNQNQLNSEMQKMKIEEMKNLETQSGGKYKGEVRLLYYDLLTKGVSANTIQSVVRTVLENMTEYDTTKLKLPSRSTAQRMVSEAGELVKIITAYELSKEKTMLCHQSDGTTKNLIHWGAHAVKLLPNDDPNNPKFFTLTVSPVSSGKADDTVKQLQDQLEEFSGLANKLGLDNDENSFSISRIGARMSDRAASKLIMEKKDNGNLYTFTCAAHKINNMASAITDASANALYVIDKKKRGMHGAKKHIYECNKLLNSGSDLFRPIVESRYLIFLQNAIPTLSAREIVLMYLEDIKDAKETPGLNRLEYSVQQGYLNTTTVTEEIVFALMYFYVCSPLMQKAKSTKSPLEMNGYYEMTIAKLQEWRIDPSGLINGDDLLWKT